MILRLASRALLAMGLAVVIATAWPVAAFSQLCHTDATAHACECCSHQAPASTCNMGCTDDRSIPPAVAPSTPSPRGEYPTAVLHFSRLQLAADATATRPMDRIRAPDTLPETLYLLERTLRC